MKVSDFSVHLAYTTYPNVDERGFIRSKLDIYKQYSESSNKYLDKEFAKYLYKPLVYHLFGSFDVVFISLIDNYKFCQKVFNLETTPSGRSINFQIVTGTCIANSTSTNFKKLMPPDLYKKTESLANLKFVHITNFKLNNGLLIGNGVDLLKKIRKCISDTLKKPKKEGEAEVEFLLVNSFNWAELTLIQLSNEMDLMQKNIINLRELALWQVFHESDFNHKDKIIENSLYNYLVKSKNINNYTPNDIMQSHIFVDTHSYSGVDYYLYNKIYKIQKSPFNQNFKSSIEMQVKPGHLNSLVDIIKNQTYIDEDRKLFETSKLKFKNGKTDYLVKESTHTNFYSNYTINKVYKNLDNGYRKHVRKIKTNYFFDIKDDTLEKVIRPEGLVESNGITDFGKCLAQKYTLCEKDLKNNLKSLGVSRHLKEKVLKAVYNYNNIIQDLILYNEFIDLKIFLQHIIDDIAAKAKILKDYFNNTLEALKDHREELDPFSITELELKWGRALDIFEEGYQNRVHNNYLYEDINEFSIDFNSAINQINAVQDFTVKSFNNIFFGNNWKDKILVTHNEIESMSNVVNVNYNVFNYMEPSLIFTSIVKEVLNGFKSKANGYGDDYFKNFNVSLKKEIDLSRFDSVSNNLFDEFNFWYFFADISKYMFTFLFDYELYEHWTWVYFLQNTNMYTATGLPDERLLNQEMLKISLINTFFFDDENKKAYKIKCPTSELFHSWQKKVKNIKELASLIIDTEFMKDECSKYISFIITNFGLAENENESFNKFVYDECYEVENDNIESGRRIIRELCLKNISKKNKFSRKLRRLANQMRVIYRKSQEYQDDLIKGEIICDESYPNEELIYFFFYTSISHSYLTILKKEMKNQLNTLPRNWDDGEPIESAAKAEINNGKIFIDPFGGFFTNNVEIRTKHFIMKNAVIQSLWNRVIIDKKRLFKK